MPQTDSPTHTDSDRDRERDRDRDDRQDRSDRSTKQKAATAASKAKDLSHVPCKFFKVGACTAGASCPFSHVSTEPGGQKETCAWFVKGNCKFGHKCALAHVLPGQSMAMDRKNKKAAQAAAGGGSATERNVKDAKTARPKRDAPAGGSSSVRNPLLAGGPTRILNSTPSSSSTSGRPPMTMPLKASISPSAPAPPLKDTDFASFAALDEMEGVKLPTAPAQGKVSQSISGHSQSSGAPDLTESADSPTSVTNTPDPAVLQKSGSPVPLPVARHSSSKNNAATDFGPVGSPPGYRSSQPTSPQRMNGAYSPGTSPRDHNGLNVNFGSSPKANSNAGFLSTSPFSAPGSQSIFLSGTSYTGASGMAASLGSGLAMMGGRKVWADSTDDTASAGSLGGMNPPQLASSLTQRRPSIVNRGGYEDFEDYGGARHRNTAWRRIQQGEELAVGDEDLEDFIPSSLTDLLTPEERSRRMSRSNSGQGPAGLSATAAALNAGAYASGVNDEPNSGVSPGGATGGHRYSRSVPAPSLLGDLKSIWADTSHPLPPSPAANQKQPPPSSSFSSRFDSVNSSVGGIPGGADDMGLSISMSSAGAPSSLGMMSPSNASAAFLPGLHHHYLNAKAKQAQAQLQAQLGLSGGLPSRLRGASGPLYSNGGTGSGASSSSIASNYLQPQGNATSGGAGLHTHTHGNMQHTYRTAPSPFDLTQGLPHQQHSQTARPIPSTHIKDHNTGSNDPLLGPHILSPGSRALQSHAPGQSLPQGLAAGYSRIHALPPLTNIVSPGTPGNFVGGSSPGSPAGGSGSYGEWSTLNMSATNGNNSNGANAPGSGLDSMFSRLSYSAAAARAGVPSHQSPPGLSRNGSGGRYPSQPQSGPLSPLSGPVVTRDDDDDLFSMDG